MRNVGINIYKFLSSNEVLDIISKYDEPHRFYHTRKHLSAILDCINGGVYDLTEDELDILSICVYFHDVVYNPKKHDNEKMSVDLMNSYTNIPEDIRKKCAKIIMDTASSEPPKEKLSNIFWLADRDIFFKDFDELIEYENNIFKEFQFVPYDIYKQKRIEFLNTCIGEDKYGEEVNKNLKSLISYIKNRKPNVGIYAGSFNPMTTGHLNVIEKSNKIFDKVIIAYGNNPDKQSREINTPKCIDFYQVESYDTLITTFIDKIEKTGVNVTLIRGIRNGADLSYESNQISFIDDIRPGTNVIYIPCDKKFEHISSSSVRSLMKFDQFLAERYIAK